MKKKKAGTGAGTDAAAATAAAATTVPRVDHFSAASSLDAAMQSAHASQTVQAQASAFPLLSSHAFDAADEADEDVDEETLKQQMAELLKEDVVESAINQAATASGIESS